MYTNFEGELPDSLSERVAMLEGIMISAATGGSHDDPFYSPLRTEFMNEPDIRDRLPDFVRKYRTLSAFWPYIKEESGTYAGRRQLITAAFTPLIDYLEAPYRTPGDMTVTDAMTVFSADGVSEAWARALTRSTADLRRRIAGLSIMMDITRS